MKDKSLYSIASRKRWAKVSPEERKKRMAELAKKKAEKMTARDRSRHGKMMVNAREARKTAASG